METDATNETTRDTTKSSTAKTYAGSCHCGAVQFRVTADLAAGAGRCNCSICTKVSQTGGIVKPEAFQLVSSEEALSSYEWGGRTSKRFFCKPVSYTHLTLPTICSV